MMMGWGFHGGGIIFMLAFWVLVIALAVWLVSALFPRSTGTLPSQYTRSNSDASKPALEILKRRYAQGEITKAEYEDIRNDLMG
ncbi:MAG: SHOCT domain-containing protein [Ardenticatenaceae bacterium]|nr:SHOCT domain-containing protein [Ardenticatenaceae bacterium]HBY93191.1 hypothetical protein [Chloroflexota bacterium]